MDTKIQYVGEYFIISPITFGTANRLLLGLEKSEIVSGFGIGDPPEFPTTADEFIGALGIRAVNDNTLVLEYLNNYFGVSLPGIECRWKAMCVSKD